MNRKLLARRSISIIVVFAVLFSMFYGIVPVSAADSPAVYTVEDLNTYGNFETDTDSDGIASKWFFESWASGFTPSIDTDHHGGQSSQKLVAASNSVGSMNFDFVTVQDTWQYKIKFWAKITQGTLTLSLHEVNGGWVAVGEAGNPRVDYTFAENGDIWKEYTYIYTPRSTTEHLGVRFTNWSGTEMTAYIDDVTMEVVGTPVITLNQPDNSEVAKQTEFTVSGTVYDEENDLQSVTVNDNPVLVTDGTFTTTVNLESGTNTITVTATDSRGLVKKKSIYVTVTPAEGEPPTIILDQPYDSDIIGEVGEQFTISGEVTDPDSSLDNVTIKVNTSDPVSEIDNIYNIKTFSIDLPLVLGENIITVTVTDEKSNATAKTLTIMLKSASEVQPYDVGAFYFSNWNPELSPHMITNTKNTYGRDNDWFGGVKDNLLSPGPWGYGPIADREPLLGWYDDSKQTVLDNHILQAASRGLDHFAFYYYWKEDGSKPRDGQNVELWKTSPYKNMMDYYIYFVADGAYNSTQWRNDIVPKLISFMKEPYYKRSKSEDRTLNNRPIIGFFGDMKSRLGGNDEDLKVGLDYLRKEARKAGAGNPLLLYDGYRTLSTYKAQGYDGFLPLNLAGIGMDDNKGIPEDYASSYPDAWKDFVNHDYSSDGNGYENYENYLLIPGGLNAFDARPWKGVASDSEGNYFYAEPSPEKFKEQLNNVKDYLDTHERSMNMATFYAWNEWGEGGTIEPDTLFGYGYIDAMQEVFELKNTNYKLAVEDNGLADIAPDVRIDAEPSSSMVTDGENAVVKVRVKNYSDSPVTGTLSINQPAKNAEEMDQAAWTVVSTSGTAFTLAAGAAGEAEFVIAVGQGENWTRHNFQITASYGGDPQVVSTFVVKVPPIYGFLEKDKNKTYKDNRMDVKLTARNYTTDAKTVNYTLELPARWSADKLTGTLNTVGYSGTGVHTNRRASDTIVVSYPIDTELGSYPIRLTITDGVFTKVENFNVDITEKAYNSGVVVNGDFEEDADGDNMPDGWILSKPANIAATMSLERNTSKTYTGSGASLKFTAPANTNEAHVIVTEAEFQRINPAKTYNIEYYARVPASGVIHLFVEEKTSSTSEGIRKDMSLDSHQWAHTSWTKFTKVYTPTPGTQFARIVFYNWNPNPLDGYIDNVSFKAVSPEGEAPDITLGQGNSTTERESITVSGSVYDEDGDFQVLRINGISVATGEDGAFSREVPLSVGANTITIVAIDDEWNIAQASITVTRNATNAPPRSDNNYVYIPETKKETVITRDGNTLRIDNTVKDGKTGVDLADRKPEDIFKDAVKDDKGVAVVKYEFKNTDKVDEYSLKLPAAVLNDSTAERKIVVDTGLGAVELPSNMLKNRGIAADSAFEISIKKADTSRLSSDVKAKIGDRPVLELDIAVDGKKAEWKNKDAEVNVSVKYTPAVDETKDADKIFIYYIDKDGKIIVVPTSTYDPKNGTVKFETNHFSTFAVGYGKAVFTDLDKLPKVKKAAEALASRELMGNGKSTFNPNTSITRGQFVKLMVTAFGLDAEFDTNFSDVKKNSYYYKHIGIAKKLGLVAGGASNRFSPDIAISRQDMVVILSRLLKLQNKMAEIAKVDTLVGFTDNAKVATYAKESLASFIKAGLLELPGKSIDPNGAATKAYAAELVYNTLKYYLNN